MDLRFYKEVLERAGVIFESGMSQSEIEDCEARHSFLFPPDLREFLMFALPVSGHFLNWRESSDEVIRRILSFPYHGICFDIEHSEFWLEEWGPQPESLADSFAIAKSAIDRAPVLIPICGHRYIPDRPHEAGNPVFSVHQTDIIHYGVDLADFFQNEFSYYFGRSGYTLTGQPKDIEFWTEFTEI